MASFVFRLQKILELREREEEAAQRLLASLQRRELQARESLRQVRAALLAHDDHCAEDPGRPLTALDLRARLATHSALTAAEGQAKRQADGVAAEVDRARGALVEAHRKVEVLRRLRERNHRRWIAEINAQERRILDDTRNRNGEMGIGYPETPASPGR